MNDTRPLILRLFSVLFGCLFVLFVVTCLFFLGKFLYFTTPAEKTDQPDMKMDRYTRTIEKRQGDPHFHLVDEAARVDFEKTSMCVRCHGNYSNIKSEKYRAYYNMHSFFLACETCHIRKGDRKGVAFKWFDDTTGEVVATLNGRNGSYGAKIIPVQKGTWGEKRLDEYPQAEEALAYIKNRDSYSEAEKKELKKKFMCQVSKEPVVCKECHQQNGYLNYRQLGYDEKRAAELSSNQIVKLLEEYNEFYFPIIFDQGGELVPAPHSKKEAR